MKTRISILLLVLMSFSSFAGGSVVLQKSYSSPKHKASYSYSSSDTRGMGLGMMTAGLGFILHGALIPNNSVGMVNTSPRVSNSQMPNKVWSVSVGIILTCVGIGFTF
jgi:hypothetical protein